MVSTSPQRPSKFIESLPPSDESSTSTNTPTYHSGDHFFSILNEMDEFESRQQRILRDRGASQSSIESLPSSTSSPTRLAAHMVDRSNTVKEGNRRSINFTRSSLDRELEGRRRSGSSSAGEGEGSMEHAGDRLARKFVGRLRALTGGKDKEREHKSYTTT